jgi:hypothetical protein
MQREMRYHSGASADSVTTLLRVFEDNRAVCYTLG